MVIVRVAVPVVMPAAREKQRTDDVNDQTNHSDQGRHTELNLRRLEKAHHRFDTNAQRDQAENQRRSKAT
ncbi:hypothetical protein D9M73_252650 [compost metagenome]